MAAQAAQADGLRVELFIHLKVRARQSFAEHCCVCVGGGGHGACCGAGVCI